MADQSSSSTTEVKPTSAPLGAAVPHTYSEDEVRALRQQGIDAERQDKWEEAAEFFSRALELCCPNMNDREAIVASGFDPLLANLLYMYGNALLYTFTANTGMFGDKADAEVKKRAEAAGGANASATEELMASILDGATAELLNALQAEEYGEEDGEEEGEEGEEEGEDETIDADAEAARQADGKATEEEEEEEAKKEKKEKKSEEEEEAAGEGEGEQDDDNGEEGEEGENGEDGEQGDGESGSEGGEADSPNDLELAWQVLELARLLYATQSNRDLELSDVHFSLGSVAFEDEKPDDAKTEFEKALKYAELAGNRRAQAQVLLLLSSIHETHTDLEAAVKELERAKELMKTEIEELKKSGSSVDIAVLESSIADIDARVFALTDKFVPAHPDDVKDLPDPSKGKVTFSFTAPTIASSSGPATEQDDNAAPVTVLQPKKKVKAPESTNGNDNTNAPSAAADDESPESRGQKRAASDAIPAAEDNSTGEESSAKRAKAAEE